MLIPHGDIVDAITPINVLLIGVANFDPSWRYIYIYRWCYYPNQHIVQRGWRILTPHEDKDDDYDDGDDDDDDDDDDDCKCGATSGLGRTCLNKC